MLKRYRFIVMLSLAVAAIASTNPGTTGTLRAQKAHVYLEEFTGAWCGYCVRGAYAIQKVEAQFPGQIVAVCYHVAQPSYSEFDPMDNAQGDSINDGIGFPAGEGGAGFPNGWTNRSANGTTWNADPGAWGDTVENLFENTPAVLGTVDALAQQPIGSVACKVDNVVYDLAAGTITATVTATFSDVLTGDLRLNLMVTEDSVTGPAGSFYDQHNYYNSQQLGPTYPNNPYYSYPYANAGWNHMHVFREAVAGIHGQAGIVPKTGLAIGTPYSMTVTFPMPTTIINPNHVHLVGLVHQYSATVAADNAVFDAVEVPLTTTPVSFKPNAVTASFDDASANNGYAYAKAPGDTTYSISVQNTGTGAISVNLAIDPNSPLPTGWSATFSPNPVPVDEGATASVTMTVSAPEQSSLIIPNIIISTTQSGAYIPQSNLTGMYMMSNNTEYGLYTPLSTIEYGASSVTVGSAETALIRGIPDSVGIHTSIIPLSSGAFLDAYPYQNFGAVFLDNLNVLDWTQDADGYQEIPTVQLIGDVLDAGGKVFLNSDYAMYYAFDGNYGGSTYTETQGVADLFTRLGLNWLRDENRWNTTTGAFTPFKIYGTSDPIGKGITVTNSAAVVVSVAGAEDGDMSGIFSVSDTNSTPIFYTDNNVNNVLGVRFVDPTTHGRMIYLGFDLGNIDAGTKVNQGDTIAGRSINWLFSTPGAAGVAPGTPSSPGITASPNPFNGISRIQYNASQDELNVTFAAYDLLGRQVAALVTNNEGGSVYSTTFDASKLAAGTYTIVAHSSKGTHEIRVVNQQ